MEQAGYVVLFLFEFLIGQGQEFTGENRGSNAVFPKVHPREGFAAFSQAEDFLDDGSGGQQFLDPVQAEKDGGFLDSRNPLFVLGAEED